MISVRFWEKVRRKLLRMRLKPIRVFCFHQVSDVFEPDIMRKCDWISLDYFKNTILKLRNNGYLFISLNECLDHLKNDRVRIKKFAVLTADDGHASLLNVLPWLVENEIPITLFVNSKYTDGYSYRESIKEKYLTTTDLEHILKYKEVTIGSHGFDHIDANNVSRQEFSKNIDKDLCVLNNILQKVDRDYVQFFAYPWGRHNCDSDIIVVEKGLIPVMMDGMDNIDEFTCLHRVQLYNGSF